MYDSVYYCYLLQLGQSINSYDFFSQLQLFMQPWLVAPRMLLAALQFSRTKIFQKNQNNNKSFQFLERHFYY